MRVRVVIVGAGLSGLFTASELMAAGVDDIVVVDDQEQPGGLARTILRDGYSLEPAVGTLLLPQVHLSPILARAGVETVAASPQAELRHVYTGGRMVPLPTSPKAVLAPLVPLTAKLRAAREPLVRTPPPPGDESLDSFLRRRLGERLGGLLAWLAASGVFAGDPARLSARAAFPLLAELEDEAGSLVRGELRRRRRRNPGATRPSSHLPVGGMAGMADGLAAELGDHVRQDFRVASLARDGEVWRVVGTEEITADHVVLAISPDVASTLVDDELATALAQSVSAPTVVVAVGGPAETVPMPEGFGVLTGPDAAMAIRGILFESSYAPHRAPERHGLAKVIAGGAIRPDVGEWDEATVVETVVDEMTQILGAAPDPSFTTMVRHLPGIPQYEVGHSRWLSGLDRQLADRPGLHLTGWGYRGVGAAHLATDAARVALAVTGAA